MALILDTGPLYASLDRRDRDHLRCRRMIENAGEPLVIPVPVLPEVDDLCATRLGPGPMVALLRDIEVGAYRLAISVTTTRRVGELVDQDADSDIGFVDASVLAVVERLGERKVATLDHRHFEMLRSRHADALELLPAG